MLMLVTADNLVQMFFGWEGVGLASYLLIGFWYKKPSANAAAIKAFVVNRVGDFGFALGIFGVFVLFGSVNFDTIFANAPSFVPAEGAASRRDGAQLPRLCARQSPALTVVCLLLFMGAMGKSAQLLLHTWLPDAMEGPTPVSALIHAATMVTAGVFMVARLSPLFELSHDGADRRHLHRRHHRLLRRHRRPRAERHQARHRLFDLLAARLHVRGARRRRLSARRSSICSRTPSSRRCCSSAPARSSTRELGERSLRTCGTATGGSAYALACALLGNEVAAAEAVRLAMSDLASSIRGVSTEEARRCLVRHVYRHAQEPADERSGAVLLPPVMVWVSQLARVQRASLALCVF